MPSTVSNKKIWLASPTMHGEELKYMQEAYDTNWMSTVGANINEVERLACEQVGSKYAVALSSGTASFRNSRAACQPWAASIHSPPVQGMPRLSASISRAVWAGL